MISLFELKEQLNVTKIYDNLVPTERMMKLLEADPYFRIENLDDLDAQITIIAWCLWLRAPNKVGEMEIVKGPHYQKSAVKIRDALKWPRSQIFQVAQRLICVTFSKDWQFDESSTYKVDCNKGEIYVYPALLDDVGLYRDPS